MVTTDETPVFRRTATNDSPWTALDAIEAPETEVNNTIRTRIRGAGPDRAYVIYRGLLFRYDGSTTLVRETLPIDDEHLRDIVLDNDGNPAMLIFDTTLFDVIGSDYVERTPALSSHWDGSADESSFHWIEAERGDGAVFVVGSQGTVVEIETPSL